MGGAYNGMSGAAAVVTAPAKTKKKVSAGKIVLIIAIVLVLLLGGAAVFFFTNKAAAMSLIMGKPKYASMIEKDSLKKATKELDIDVLSDQIRSVSGVLSTIASTSADAGSSIFDLANTADTKSEMARLAIGPEPVFEGVDIKSMIKGYNEFIKSTYGVNSISGSMSAKIKVGSKLADVDEELSEVLDLINGCEFTYDLASTDKMMGTEFGVKIDGKTIDARIIIEDDGSMYIAFPFATDRALKYKIATVESSSASEQQASSAVLDLESSEISRLIDEIVDIYSGYIKNSSVTMEKGSMNVAGLVVEGKEIKADINGKNLENLFKEVFEHIANDKYLSGKVVEYIKNFDEDFTEVDYNNAVTDLVKDMTGVTQEDKLIVTMIVNNSGKILAKSYTVAGNGQQLGTIAFTDNDTTSAVDFKVMNQSVASVTNVKTSDKDGKITVKVGYGTFGSIGMVLEYAGVDNADFGKTTVPVGTYTFTIDTSNLANFGIDEETMALLNGLSFKLSSTVSGNTATNSFAFSVRDYIDLDLSAKMTLSDDTSKFTAPSNFIDLTPIINGEDLNDATMETLMGYVEELTNGLSNAIKGTKLEDVFSDLILAMTPPKFEEPPVTPSRPADTPTDTYYNSVNELYKKVENEAEEFMSLLEGYDWYEAVMEDDDLFDDFTNSAAYEIAERYADDLMALGYQLMDIVEVDNAASCTKEQLDEFNKRFSNILKQKDSAKSALDSYYPSQLTGMGPAA